MAESKDAFNTLLDRILNWLPRDPYTQTKYMYYLNGIIVSVLILFTLSNFYSFFKTGVLSYLFGGLLTGVFSFMSLFSFRATRDAHNGLKQLKDGVNNAVNQFDPEKYEAELKKQKETKNNEKTEEYEKVPKYIQ